MKILLITSHLKIGGIPVYTVTLANHLCKKGHGVFVASSGGELKDELSSEIVHIDVPLETHSVLSPKIWLAVFRLRGLIKKEKIDIMHTHTRVAHFTAHILSKMTGVPYVVTWHGFYRPHFFRKLMPCWGERTIAISKSVARHLVDDFKREEAKVRLVFNGVDASKFRNDYTEAQKRDIKKRYGLKDGPVVGIICRLAGDKGHAFLVEAFKGVVSQVPEAQLVIVGEGKLKDTLKSRVARLGIGDSVHFFDGTLNPREFLAVMDVFTRPSIEEGFGIAVVEAMLMGVPVVATNVGGFKSILNEGEFGILVEPKDVSGLKDAIVKMLTDRAFAEKIAAAAQRHAALNFSAEKMAARIEDVYTEVVKESKRPKNE